MGVEVSHVKVLVQLQQSNFLRGGSPYYAYHWDSCSAMATAMS
jgi:hypothetical protein